LICTLAKRSLAHISRPCFLLVIMDVTELRLTRDLNRLWLTCEFKPNFHLFLRTHEGLLLGGGHYGDIDIYAMGTSVSPIAAQVLISALRRFLDAHRAERKQFIENLYGHAYYNRLERRRHERAGGVVVGADKFAQDLIRLHSQPADQ